MRTHPVLMEMCTGVDTLETSSSLPNKVDATYSLS